MKLFIFTFMYISSSFSNTRSNLIKTSINFMSHIKYHDNQLHIDDLSVALVVKNIKTPFYCYSYNQLAYNYNNFSFYFKEKNVKICYALKSNSNLSVVKLFAELGAGADCVSGGEIKRALKAGVSKDKIVFSGVGKSYSELEYAIVNDIYQINAESQEEILVINQIASKYGKKVKIAIRVNPDIHADTHHKITTGTKDNKFGISSDDFVALFLEFAKLGFIELSGISMHIGSQITDITPFEQAFAFIEDLYLKLKGNNIEIKTIDLGGGIGISYHNEEVIDLEKYAALVTRFTDKYNLEVILEPGRYLTAKAGVIVTKVLYHKGKFLIVDASMADFMRSALYDAYHEIIPIIQPNTEEYIYDIVGPICESSDVLGKNVKLPKLAKGDFLVIKDAGAYGAVMSNFYNTRPLIAEYMIKGSHIKCIRRIFTEDDIINLDNMVDWDTPNPK